MRLFSTSSASEVADLSGGQNGAAEASAPTLPNEQVLPRRLGLWLCKTKGLKWLGETYEDELQKRFRPAMKAFEESKRIEAKAKEEIRSEVSSSVGRIQAYESWDGVAEQLFTLLILWILWLTVATSVILPIWGWPVTLPLKRIYVTLMLLPLGALAVLLGARVGDELLSVRKNPLGKFAYFLTVAVSYCLISAATPLRFRSYRLSTATTCHHTFIHCLDPCHTHWTLPPWVRTTPRLSLAIYFTVFAVGSSIIAYKLPHWPEWIDDGLQVGVFAAVLTLGLTGLALLSHILFQALLWRWKNAKHPTAELVDTILDLLIEVETKTDQWRDLAYRRAIAQKLEYLAQRLEYGLSRGLSRGLLGSDHGTDSWVRSETRQMAYAVRQWKRDILLSGDNAFEKLLGVLARSLFHAAGGEWNLLECAQYKDDHSKQENRSKPSLLSRSLLILRNVIAAVLPLITVWAIKRSSLRVNTSLLDTLMPFAIAWLAIQILTWFDPKARDTISGPLFDAIKS